MQTDHEVEPEAGDEGQGEDEEGDGESKPSKPKEVGPVRHNLTFVIGQGDKVKYKPSADECLSRCQLLDKHEGGKSCRSVRGDSIKVSKAGEEDHFKLCCVPKKCNYQPGTDTWTIHHEHDHDLRKDFYQPLTHITSKDYVYRRTCLCCDKDGDTVPWGPDTAVHCMKAYEPESYAGSFGRMALRKMTFTLSDYVMKSRCSNYCTRYPGHTSFKFAYDAHDLRMREILNPDKPGGR